MSQEIMRADYTAGDGTRVSITAADVVRYCVAPGTQLTEQECATFLGLCRARGLNPFARDCYLVKYRDNPASIITSKDYFVKTAAGQPTFDGYDAGVIVGGPGGGVEFRDGSFVGGGESLLGGWATVYDKGRSHPCKATVSLKEYSTGRSMWAGKPATMIRKVALVQALREAYPERFNGLYDRAEMGAAGESAPVEVEAVPVDAPQAAQDAPGPRVAGRAAPSAQDAPKGPSGGFSEGAMKAMADMARAAAQACGGDEGAAKRAVWDAVRDLPDKSDDAAVCATASRAAREFQDRVFETGRGDGE